VKQFKNTIKHLSIFLVFLLVLGITPGVKAYQSSDSQDNSVLVSFPVGTMFKGILQYNASTKSNNVGDIIELILPADILVGDAICIPKNSKLIGDIIRLGRAQQGKNGFIEVVFNRLQFPDDQEISILAHVWTKDGTGILGGELTERIGYKKVSHSIWGIGSVAQLIPDGPRQMGKETEILTGSEWILVLDKELKLNIIKDY